MSARFNRQTAPCIRDHDNQDNSMPVSWNDLLDAFELASVSPRIRTFCPRDRAESNWRSDLIDQLEEASNDLKGSQKAVASLVRNRQRCWTISKSEDKYLPIPIERMRSCQASGALSLRANSCRRTSLRARRAPAVSAAARGNLHHKGDRTATE